MPWTCVIKGLEFPEAAPRRVLSKKYSENMQQIYRRKPIPKCDFNKAVLQLHWNHTLAWLLLNFLFKVFLKSYISFIKTLSINLSVKLFQLKTVSWVFLMLWILYEFFRFWSSSKEHLCSLTYRKGCCY